MPENDPAYRAGVPAPFRPGLPSCFCLTPGAAAIDREVLPVHHVLKYQLIRGLLFLVPGAGKRSRLLKK